MKTEKIEIIQQESRLFRVRRTIKNRHFGVFGCTEKKEVSYLSEGGFVWYSEYDQFTRCSFHNQAEAEEAYRRYCEFTQPPPSPKVIKVLKDE